MKLSLYSDGASRGNPGRAAYGFVIVNAQDVVLHEDGKTMGQTTNNAAEYMALFKGMEHAVLLGASELICYSDSQLMVRQMSGEYKVKQPHLKEYVEQLRVLEKRFDKVKYVWVERNTGYVARADQLCNFALDGMR
jgi:ribonuclease HI